MQKEGQSIRTFEAIGASEKRECAQQRKPRTKMCSVLSGIQEKRNETMKRCEAAVGNESRDKSEQ